MHQIKNIIFDIGNVLARFRWKDYIEEMGLPPEVAKRLGKATVQGPYWDEVDRGALSLEEIVRLCTKLDPEIGDLIAKFMYDRNGLVVEYDYSAGLVARLKEKGYRVYLLSNYARDTFAYAKEHFRFIPLTDGGVISYEIQKVKPEPEIYKELLVRYQLIPEECVFLDDLERNLQGAAAFGIHTIHFTDYETAMQELEKLCMPCQRKKGLIFDLDGTLWDSTEEAARIWSSVADEYPKVQDAITPEKLRRLYGLPLEEIAEKLLLSVPKAMAMQVMEKCVQVQCPILEKTGAKLMGDVAGVFRELKEHYRIFIVSNCKSGYIEAFLKAHGLADLVDDFTCPGETGKRKADNIRLICDRNGLGLQEVFYIGDTCSDELAAHEAGVPFIFAAYGFGVSESYEYRIEKIEELPGLLHQEG